MTNITEARQRLDKTLTSHELSDCVAIRKIVLKQLQNSFTDGKVPNEGVVAGGKQSDQLVEKKSKQLFALLEDLRSAKGERGNKIVAGEWKLKENTPIMRVMYREGPEGAPYHSLCLDGLIDGPMATALCVGWEAPLYKQWWPQFSAPTFKMVESHWLKRNSVGGDLSLLRIKVPWPLAMREVLLSEYELEYFEEDLIVVMYASFPEEPDETLDGISATDVPKIEPNVVRMDLAGGFAMQKIGPNRMFFRLICDLDMKLDFVPPWLINFIARQLVGHGHKLYQKAISSVKGSAFEDLLETEPMYARVKCAVDMKILNGEAPPVNLLPSNSPNLVECFREELEPLELALENLSDSSLESMQVVVDTGMRTVNPIQRTQPDSNVQTNGELHYGWATSQVEAAVPLYEDLASLNTLSHELEEELRPDAEAEDPEVAWALQVLAKLITHVKEQNASSDNRQDVESLRDSTTATDQMHLQNVNNEEFTRPASALVQFMNGRPRLESAADSEHRNEEQNPQSVGRFGTGWHKVGEQEMNSQEIGKYHKVMNSIGKDDLKSVEANPPSNARHQGYRFYVPFWSKRKHCNDRNDEKPTLYGPQNGESKSNHIAKNL
ncbi:unnamed protein product [Sphagnum jensenii]|uniref:START domain-containing protein n=1 Tax=Sphagnum jensenii TaxID=128206 RepID=A0ABP0WIL0_9BRYO